MAAKHSGKSMVKEVNSALVNLQKKPLKKKERKKENTCMHRAISAIHAPHVRTARKRPSEERFMHAWPSKHVSVLRLVGYF
jgi:hypothetical protein